VRVSVQPKRLPFFKVGKELKERVNEGRFKAAAPKLVEATPTPAPVSSTGPIADSGANAASDAPAGSASRATA
jgi:hypothetical protein